MTVDREEAWCEVGGLHTPVSGQRSVAGYCECNKTLGSLNARGFLNSRGSVSL